MEVWMGGEWVGGWVVCGQMGGWVDGFWVDWWVDGSGEWGLSGVCACECLAAGQGNLGKWHIYHKKPPDRCQLEMLARPKCQAPHVWLIADICFVVGRVSGTWWGGRKTKSKKSLQKNSGNGECVA